jgi:CHAT domain-containing protein/tetratricopeptide (TPR) repeat protein
MSKTPKSSAVLALLTLATLGGGALAQNAPPPRTTADVLAVLEQHQPDPAKIERLRAEVAKQPPQTSDRIDLRKFYQQRGEAAGQLGMVRQQLEDMRKALDYAPSGDPERWTIYGQIGQAEMQAGNYPAAMKMWEAAPGETSLDGQRVCAWATVAGARAAVGNLEGARQALQQSESYLAAMQSSRMWQWLESSWRSCVERARGGVLRLQGKHADAEVAFRQVVLLTDRHMGMMPAMQSLQTLSLPPMSTYVRIALNWEGNLTRGLLEQGKYADAEIAARNSLRRALDFFGRYSPETGAALVRLALALFEQGRFEEASTLARAAVDIYEKIGAARHSLVFVQARRLMAAALVEDGKYAAADAVFQQVRDDLQKDPASAEELGTGSLAWVYTLTKLGRATEGAEQARRISERQSQRYGDAFYTTAEARGFFALALTADKRYDEALQEFRAAIPALLRATSERTGEESLGIGKTRRLARILEAYIELLGHFAASGQAPAGIDPVAEAFLIADLARGSSVQRALTAASARAAIRDPQLAKLAREEQDGGQRIAALTAILVDLLSRPPDKQLPAVIAQMRKDIDELRARRIQLKQEIERRFPDYANLIDPKPVPLETARKVLAPGEALIVLYGTDERTFVWAVPPQGPVRFHAAPLGRAQRDALVASLRGTLDFGDAPLERFPAFDVGAAHQLYNALLAPVEPAWAQAKSLLVVPHGSLALLPFSVLVTEPTALKTGALRFEGYKAVPWLVRRAAITQLPSVNTLAALRAVRRAQAPSKPFIGFGDPVFAQAQLAQAPGGATRSLRHRNLALSEAEKKASSVRLERLAPLPDTADELESIARALGAATQQDVYLRLKASEHTVKTVDLSDRRVVAFATHGLVPGELDGLTQPALALSNPQLTGEKDADGLLAMDEILGLKLNADWVVLSACNTASAGGASEEAVSGLGKAFFYAGARALLVSNWPIETVSARLLTTEIFRRQAADPKLARAEALRQAMLHLMDREVGLGADGKPGYSYAHPMFWAPFSLVGDGS